MASSPLLLAIPRFLWRGRWFWGAWLLILLLPWTREEARLHFLGSRYFSEIYGQDWQERWMADENATTSGMSEVEREIWLQLRGVAYSFASSQGGDPTSTTAGRLFKKFPHEKWLHPLALSQSLGWGRINSKSYGKLSRWAQQGEKLDPHNAIYPLTLSKIYGDSKRRSEQEKALERAAKCTLYDEGTSKLHQVALRAVQKAGITTWSEKWRVWSQIENDEKVSNSQWTMLINQLSATSLREITDASQQKKPVVPKSVLRRSNAMMRVSLLFQAELCGADKWHMGAQWARSSWRIIKSPKSFWTFPAPTVNEFTKFARAQNSAPNVRLAEKCAARMRLLSPYSKSNTGFPKGAIFSMFEAMWVIMGNGIGFGVLAFSGSLLLWWWIVSLCSWRAMGQESRQAQRVVPATLVVAFTLAAFGLLITLLCRWLNAPSTVGVGPPVGQLEVACALGIFAFFSPPLILAAWWAIRTVWLHREVMGLPARAQLEMNLAPLDVFMLARATNAVMLAALTLAVGLALLWGTLLWEGLVGYDWLRLMWPRLSPRIIHPYFTSLDSLFTPIYCGLGLIIIALLWFISWRYGTDPQRRPVYHDGLRGWKESIGCALTLSVWVYVALLLTCHFSGVAFSNRLEVAARHGEGAFVRGF